MIKINTHFIVMGRKKRVYFIRISINTFALLNLELYARARRTLRPRLSQSVPTQNTKRR